MYNCLHNKKKSVLHQRNVLQETVGGKVSQANLRSNEAWICSSKCDELLKQTAQESDSVHIKTGSLSGKYVSAKQKLLGSVYGERGNVIVCGCDRLS